MMTTTKIFVTSRRGIVRTALVCKHRSLGFANLRARTRQELDLTDQATLQQFLTDERPDGVFIVAAKVSGTQTNNQYRADIIRDGVQP